MLVSELNKNESHICFLQFFENIAYACGRYFGTGRIIKTTDKGVSWELVFNDSSLAKTLIDCYFWTADSGIAVGGYNTSSYEFGNAAVSIPTFNL